MEGHCTASLLPSSARVGDLREEMEEDGESREYGGGDADLHDNVLQRLSL